MAEEPKGQETATPTVETKTGQKTVSESPTEDLTEKIIQAAKAEEAAASEKDKKEEKDKPPPYDQDPKWKKARAAEARVEKILDKHGLKSVDDIEFQLETGLTISEILGGRDAKKLIEDYESIRAWKEKVETYWKEQETKKLEEEETPEETVQRLKKEREDYKNQEKAEAQRKKEAADTEKAVKDYGKYISEIVEQQGLVGEEAKMAKLFLGVDNPFNEIDDITNKAAVKKMAKDNAAKFKTFLDSVRQEAVDGYAKGKGKFIPISATETPGKESVSKKKLPDNATVDQTFEACRDEFLSVLAGGISP